MYKNLNLYIDTGKKPIELPVHIDGMTDKKTSLKTGYKGRLVKQIVVLTRDDVETPKTLEDLECIVERSKTESIYCHQQGTDEPKYIPVEKETLKKVFPISRDIKVVCSLDMGNLKPYMFDGSHYHLSLHGTLKKKVKVVEASDKRMFNILFHGLKARQACFIGRYVSFNREKFCAIYPDEHHGFVMSNLIHANYFRQRSVNHIVKEGEEALTTLLNAGMSKKRLAEISADGKPLYEMIFDKIHERLKKDCLDPETYKDRYEELLRRMISDLQERDDGDGRKSPLDLEELIDEGDGELDDILDL
jgi:non-homologous end joining protein Ku